MQEIGFRRSRCFSSFATGAVARKPNNLGESWQIGTVKASGQMLAEARFFS
jgi:hypothetical protein